MPKKYRSKDKPEDFGTPEITQEVALSYPVAVETGTYYEPYQALPGAVDNVVPIGAGKAKKKKSKGAEASGNGDPDESARHRSRYDRYIDSLIRHRGNQVAALADALGLPTEEIAADVDRYRADIARGRNTSSISDMLEEYNAGKAARARLLAHHLYSEDPKVSLVAWKLAADLDGDKHDHGTTYEHYLRIVMNKPG
jgi:hypothetical protein